MKRSASYIFDQSYNHTQVVTSLKLEISAEKENPRTTMEEGSTELAIIMYELVGNLKAVCLILMSSSVQYGVYGQVNMLYDIISPYSIHYHSLFEPC